MPIYLLYMKPSINKSVPITVAVIYRNAETLIPIFEKHVEKNSVIYTDGWKAYLPLKEKGYKWFNVIHTRNYTQEYINPTTNESHIVHTNQMECKWGIYKMHFRKIRGMLCLFAIYVVSIINIST